MKRLPRGDIVRDTKSQKLFFIYFPQTQTRTESFVLEQLLYSIRPASAKEERREQSPNNQNENIFRSLTIGKLFDSKRWKTECVSQLSFLSFPR